MRPITTRRPVMLELWRAGHVAANVATREQWVEALAVAQFRLSRCRPDSPMRPKLEAVIAAAEEHLAGGEGQ